MMLELNHEQRQELDKLLEDAAIRHGMILVKNIEKEVKACDIVIEALDDNQVRELVKRIKKRKKVLIEA